MTPFDIEIERTAHAIKREVREATLAQRILVENQKLISYDTEEMITMAAAPPQTLGDYCKRTDEGQVSKGFVPKNPANFDIKNYTLSGLRDNLFDGNTIRDLWEHLTRFYETTSMCRPSDIMKDQVKLWWFGF